MSVINQMLKDLDERQAEQGRSSSMYNPVLQESPSHKNLIVIVLILILLNVIGFLGWQLYGSDKASSVEGNTQVQAEKITFKPSESLAPVPNNARANSLNNNDVSGKEVDRKNTHVPPQTSTSNNNDLSKVTEHRSDVVSGVIEKDEKFATNTQSVEENEPAFTASQHKHSKEKDNAKEQEIHQESTIEKDEPEEVPPSSFSISRKHISPEVLIEKKIAQAESALEKNDITKAESLLEEVLLLDPLQINSRKKLAALWFGRESFQDAINILNHGISLSPKNAELRLMKARIYLSKDLIEKAYIALKGLTDTNNVEYLSLLATLAQQFNEHDIAIKVYQRLTKLQPSLGKWWLGLAVALDSYGNFKEAVVAYKNAIKQDDMSRDSIAFMKKRLSELGE